MYIYSGCGGELSTYPKQTAKIKVTAGMRLKTAETNVADINAKDSKNRFWNKVALLFY